MKHFFNIFITIAVTLITCIQGVTQTTLNQGDISFIGFNSSLPSRDGFAFVTWVPLSTGTVIKFTDNGFRSSLHSNTAGNLRELEQTIHWTATSAIAAGTVIVIEANGSTTPSTISSHGSISIYNADGSSTSAINLGNNGDQIFAFQGNYTTSNNESGTLNGILLSGIGFQGSSIYTSWLTSGEAGANRSYLPSDLSEALFFPANTVAAEYTGPRNNQTIAQLKAAITNLNNWSKHQTVYGVSEYNTTSFQPLSAPVITSQPANSTVCENQSTSFSITASGATGYQWQVSTNSGTNYTDLTNNGVYTGASTATLIINNTTFSLHNNLYRCIASGPVTPAATSQPATLNVLALPVASAQPETVTICSGSSSAIGLTADLQGTTFSWTFSLAEENVSGTANGNGNSINQTLSGSGTITYTITPTQSGCTGATITATVNVLPMAEILTQPTTQTTCPGEAIAFTIEATEVASFQWQVNSGSGFADINNEAPYSGSATSTLSVTEAAASMNGYTYRATVTGNCPMSLTSESVTLHSSDAEVPEFTYCPEDITTTERENLYLIPEAVDNCTENPIIELTSGLGIGATFPVGTTTETYTVVDASGNSATCTFEVTVELVTSLYSKSENLNVNPNPASNSISIHLARNNGPVEIQWHTLSGHFVEALKLANANEYRYDINHLPKGVYLLHVITSQEHHVQKILVK